MVISAGTGRLIGLLLIAGLAAFSVAAGVSAAPGPQPPLNVTITNTPLPVSGTLGIAGTVDVAGSVGIDGTVATTQSGSWSVGITGTPAVTSGDSTVLLGSFAGDVPGGSTFTEAISSKNAVPYRSIRVTTNCFDGGACANIRVRVYTVVGNRSYLMEDFPMQNFQVASRVYEVIGTNVAVQLLNNNAGTNTNIGVAMFGRAN